jgi:hypothetical protein
MEWITVVLEEYKTLRTESLESMKNQQSALRAGTAAAGILIGSGFNLWNKALLPEFIFLAFAPVICYLALIIWMGEVVRMMRAGKFLSELEIKISAEYPEKKDTLSWEKWLRIKSQSGETPQMKFNYQAIIALFFVTALGSIGIGIYKIWNLSFWIFFIIGIEASIFIIVFISVYRLGSRFKSS